MAAPLTGDPRFFQRAGPFTLAEIAAAAGAEAPADAGGRYQGVAPLEAAGAEDVSFLDNRRYAPALRASRCGAAIVHPAMRQHVPAGCAALVSPHPYLAWARVCALFHPVPPAVPGVHPSAVVEPGAMVDPSAEVGPFVHIGAGAEIGSRCRLAPHAVIGPGVVLGADCRIGSHASISHALLGARVTVFPGARIGQEGFGFATTADGRHITVPQLGRVVLEDDVEIGANTTIDRGSTRDTVIGAGTRIDNLVQIGHNVRTGRGCVIVAMAGISGSTVLEDFVQVGGQAGLTGHLTIGRGAGIAAQTGVMNNVPAGARMFGSPAEPSREWFRRHAILKRLAEQADPHHTKATTETDDT